MKNFRSALLAAALSLAVAAGSATAAQAATKIRVGASPTPHAEILKVANDVLKPQGYELQIIEYSDYVQPNMALEGKELDANFFQHKPYLDDFNKEKGTKLISIGTVHYEPFGIYAGKTDMPHSRLYRIIFNGRSSFEPVISNLVLECGAPVNIMFADTRDIGGTAFGQMVLQLPDNEDVVRRIVAYADSKGLMLEEMKNV